MKSQKHSLIYKLTVTGFSISFILQAFLFNIPQFLNSPTESFTSSSDTLSNSRLSFYGKISGAQPVGTTYFTLKSSGAPDVNNNHLFPRDSISIGSNGPTPLTVGTQSGTLSFTTTAGITNQVADGDPVYATQSATHTITFTTASSVFGNGIIRAYIPASDSTSASDNGAPDQGGFDLNTLNGNESGNVTCSGGGVSWGAYAATSSATVGNNQHTVQCAFYGTLASGQTITMTIGGTGVKMINPAPKSGHTQGTADTYTIKLQQLQYPNYNLVDSVNMSVSPIEGVLVSATINPSLTFTIAGESNGNSRCGVTDSISTTAMTIPYGELTGSDTFYNASQVLSVATNATNGYSITVTEDDNLKKPGTSTYIADSTCDSGHTCSTGSTGQGQWQSTSSYGWGYSLHNVSATNLAFNYSDTTGGNCTVGTTYCSKPFACNNISSGSNCASTATPDRIAYSTAPVSSQSFYVCYRLNYGPTQQTGYYQTRLLYIPSATF